MMRFLIGLGLIGVMFSAALADTVIVNETFDGYADDNAFRAVWVPRAGNGGEISQLQPLDSGILTVDATTFPGIQGQAIDHLGALVTSPSSTMVNQYEPAIGGPSPTNVVLPTAELSVFLRADIFESGIGNERMSVGLRNRTSSQNILEMGFFNTNSCDPTVAGCTSPAQNATAATPGFYTGTAYGFRLINFGAVTAPLLIQPDWQYFQLPTELDRTTDVDTIVNIGDVGAGWHRYMATITPTSITMEIDLFRDGLRNTSKTPDEITGIRPGTPGVDTSVTYQIETLPSGFDSLRIGGPSGVTSAGSGAMALDNIILNLVDAASANTPDFNISGTVDAADYTVWRDHLGLMGTGTQATGDANGDTNVDQTDYNLWKAAFGTMPGSGAFSSIAVPEPAALVLSLLGGAMLVSARRRR